MKSNINNPNIDISKIDSYFAKFRLKEGQKLTDSEPKRTAQEECIRQQLHEMNEINDAFKAEIDSYNKKIEQYGNNEYIENALKFKIRILIRNNSANLINQIKQQKIEHETKSLTHF